MSTLQANSTFLPVLDDLLSPDFRPMSTPGMTPQTPAETPRSASANKTIITFAESHTGQLTTKATSYGTGGVLKDSMTESQINGVMKTSLHEQGHQQQVKKHGSNNGSYHFHHNPHLHAAIKIQQWWKHKKTKSRVGNGTTDIKAERVKHSIRHQRTEDHVRYLETEVHRLKSALATERKLRSLQLEAIRSLWTQVQKVSSISSSPGASGGGDMMSQSMPNGLLNKSRDAGSGGGMSMSLHSALEGNTIKSQDQQEGAALSKSSVDVAVCSCTKEIQNLRLSFSSEMGQLRSLIDQLKSEGGNSNSSAGNSTVLVDPVEETKISQQKRPLTLNLVGHPSTTEANLGDEGNPQKETKKEEISGYASKMACNILEDAKEKDDEATTTTAS